MDLAGGFFEVDNSQRTPGFGRIAPSRNDARVAVIVHVALALRANVVPVPTSVGAPVGTTIY
jgi:hypothetical protein